MADQDGVSGSEAANAARFSVLTQFTRDFSFENPNAPRTLAPQSQAPRINLQINVNARQLSPTDYEVTPAARRRRRRGDGFRCSSSSCSTAGVFRLENIPADQVQPVVMIEGPRLLFPFARQIVAEAVRSGGYPAALCRSHRFPWPLPAAPRAGAGDAGRPRLKSARRRVKPAATDI